MMQRDISLVDAFLALDRSADDCTASGGEHRSIAAADCWSSHRTAATRELQRGAN